MSAYQEALKRGRKIGVSRAPTAEAIAMFCESTLQILVGAVSPEMVWTGAIARRMSLLDFGRLCARPREAEVLQWLDTVIVTHLRGRYEFQFSSLPLPGGPAASYTAEQAVYELLVTTCLDEAEIRTLLREARENDVSGREIAR